MISPESETPKMMFSVFKVKILELVSLSAEELTLLVVKPRLCELPVMSACVSGSMCSQ